MPDVPLGQAAIPQAMAMRMTAAPRLARYGVGLGLGALASLGQAPWGLWPLTLLALALVFGAMQAGWRVRQAAWLGLTVGTGYYLVALSWIVEPFLVDAARHGWMAPFALVFLAAGLGLFWMGAFAVAQALGGRAVVWVAALVLAEALRGVVFTGFPWAQVGHVLIDTGARHWAAFSGPLGLSLLVLAGAVALWHLAVGQRVAGAAGMVVLAVLWLTGPLTAPDLPVAGDAPLIRLVQPNAPQDEKWDPDKMRLFFDRQVDFTAADAVPDLVVWPETAVPVLLNHAEGALARIADAARGAPVVLGMQRYDGARIFNSLVVLDGAGEVAALYDKHHLVPFGEYIPFGDVLGRFGLRGLAQSEGDGFSAGPGPQVIGLPGLGRALPLICYEGVFPRDVAGLPERPDLLLLITNDAWFGQVSGPYQHLAQAQLRSTERGLPMIRVANTGISAMIDSTGRVTASLPLGQAGWLDAPLPAAAAATIYARMGDWPLLALMGVLVFFAALRAFATRRRI